MPPLTTVSHVDINRYLGTWYEIAKIPNFFQRQCFASTAHYSLDNTGTVIVRNECHKNSQTGPIKSITGKAWVVDPVSSAKLKVQFFWPFRGDYWILALGDNYEYAVVGEPKRRYLWILSRTEHMEEARYQRLLGLIKAQGYDLGKIERSTPKPNQ